MIPILLAAPDMVFPRLSAPFHFLNSKILNVLVLCPIILVASNLNNQRKFEYLTKHVCSMIIKFRFFILAIVSKVKVISLEPKYPVALLEEHYLFSYMIITLILKVLSLFKIGHFCIWTEAIDRNGMNWGPNKTPTSLDRNLGYSKAKNCYEYRRPVVLFHILTDKRRGLAKLLFSRRNLSITSKLYRLHTNARKRKHLVIDKEVYPILFDRDMLKLAYKQISVKSGSRFLNTSSHTKPVTPSKILCKISEELKDLSFNFRSLKIPNKKAKKSTSSLEDKIVINAINNVLATIYEPLFLENNYGFRQSSSCRSALKNTELFRTSS